MRRRYKITGFMKVNVIAIMIAAIVLMLGIGYSTFSAGLDVRDINAVVRSTADIRITGLSSSDYVSGANVNSEEFSTKTVFGNVDLPNSDSTVTFDVVITNIGNVEMGINDIIGLPNNLTYSISNYTLGTTLCDDNNSTKCKLGSVSTVHVTIGYADNAYDSNNTSFNLDMEFEFSEIINVARIGNQYYTSLASAVAAVPMNGTLTTIVLIKNTSEHIDVAAGKNIALDFNNFVISNFENFPVITIQGGTVRMSNGLITSDATQGAINVESNGMFIMTGGSIITSGNRQALYVDTGSAEISGTAYLESSAVLETGKIRGTVQTLATGTVTITGGTIVSKTVGGVALSNAGTSIVGIKDGNVSTVSPEFISEGYGAYITSGTFNYYDGVFKGATSAINDDSLISDTETGYTAVYSSESIQGVPYDKAILGHGITVTFDPNQGTMDSTTRTVMEDTAIGPLPIPTRTNYYFDGWFTIDNRQIGPNEIISAPVTFYAHWTFKNDANIAAIGNTQYKSLAAAVSAVTTNAETTITLLRNTNENIKIGKNKNIIFDFQSYTLSNSNTNAVIETESNVTMVGGNIETNSDKTSAINVKSTGSFTITGGSIVATGKRQAIYNEGGTVTISGNPYLSSRAEYASNNKRGTVQNLSYNNKLGTMVITGGTIESFATNGVGVSNSANLTIGVDDGNVSTSVPLIKGIGTGVINTGTFNFYDGILKGQSNAISGNVVTNQNNSIVTSSEVIDGVTYQVKYLQ